MDARQRSLWMIVGIAATMAPVEDAAMQSYDKRDVAREMLTVLSSELTTEATLQLFRKVRKKESGDPDVGRCRRAGCGGITTVERCHSKEYRRGRELGVESEHARRNPLVSLRGGRPKKGKEVEEKRGGAAVDKGVASFREHMKEENSSQQEKEACYAIFRKFIFGELDADAVWDASAPLHNFTSVNGLWALFLKDEIFIDHDPRHMSSKLKSLHNACTQLYAIFVTGRENLYIDLAIQGWEMLIKVITPDHSEAWGAVHHSLGMAYQEQTHGDQQRNNIRAIFHFNSSLSIYTRSRFPSQCGKAHEKLAKSLLLLEKHVDVIGREELSHIFRQEMSIMSGKQYPKQEFMFGDFSIQHFELSIQIFGVERLYESLARTYVLLGEAYGLKKVGDISWSQDRAISCFEAALQVPGFTAESYPHDWVKAQRLLGMRLLMKQSGEKFLNIENAINHLKATLEIYQMLGAMQDWAEVHIAIADAWMQTISAARLFPGFNALQNYNESLSVYHKSAHPIRYAEINTYIANVCLKIIEYSKVESEASTSQLLQQSLKAYSTALEVYAEHNRTESWAVIQLKLGTTKVTSYQTQVESKSQEMIEEAIDHFNQSLSFFQHRNTSQDYLDAKIGLGTAMCERISSSRSSDLEAALSHFSDALSVINKTVHPKEWAKLNYQMAECFVSRIEGNRTLNLASARGHCESALSFFTIETFPEMWARAQCTLGWVLASQQGGNRGDLLELAISHHWQALRVFSRKDFPQLWAATHVHLGEAYTNRVNGEKSKNLEMAIDSCNQALEVYRKNSHPLAWARVHDILAKVYLSRDGGVRSENVEHAIRCWRNAIKVYNVSKHEEQWGRIQASLGMSYSQRKKGARRTNLQTAISHLQNALAFFSREEQLSTWMTLNLGLVDAFSSLLADEEEIARQVLHHGLLVLDEVVESSNHDTVVSLWFKMATAYDVLSRWENDTCVRRNHSNMAIHLYEKVLDSSPPTRSLQRSLRISLRLGYLLRKSKEGDGFTNLQKAISVYENATDLLDPTSLERCFFERRIGLFKFLQWRSVIKNINASSEAMRRLVMEDCETRDALLHEARAYMEKCCSCFEDVELDRPIVLKEALKSHQVLALYHDLLFQRLLHKLLSRTFQEVSEVECEDFNCLCKILGRSNCIHKDNPVCHLMSVKLPSRMDQTRHDMEVEDMMSHHQLATDHLRFAVDKMSTRMKAFSKVWSEGIWNLDVDSMQVVILQRLSEFHEDRMFVYRKDQVSDAYLIEKRKALRCLQEALEMLPSNRETRDKRRQLHIQTLRILLRESSSELTLDDLIDHYSGLLVTRSIDQWEGGNVCWSRCHLRLAEAHLLSWKLGDQACMSSICHHVRQALRFLSREKNAFEWRRAHVMYGEACLLAALENERNFPMGSFAFNLFRKKYMACATKNAKKFIRDPFTERPWNGGMQDLNFPLLDRARRHFHKCLSVGDAEDQNVAHYAQLCLCLIGLHMPKRLIFTSHRQGDPSNEVDDVISVCTQVLQTLDRKENLIRCFQFHFLLGRAYSCRIKGSRLLNLDHALKHLLQSISLLSEMLCKHDISFEPSIGFVLDPKSPMLSFSSSSSSSLSASVHLCMAEICQDPVFLSCSSSSLQELQAVHVALLACTPRSGSLQWIRSNGIDDVTKAVQGMGASALQKPDLGDESICSRLRERSLELNLAALQSLDRSTNLVLNVHTSMRIANVLVSKWASDYNKLVNHMFAVVSDTRNLRQSPWNVSFLCKENEKLAKSMWKDYTIALRHYANSIETDDAVEMQHLPSIYTAIAENNIACLRIRKIYMSMFRSDPEFHTDEKELMNDSESEMPSDTEMDIPYHSWIQLQYRKCRDHFSRALSLMSERIFPVEHLQIKQNFDAINEEEDFPMHTHLRIQELPLPHVLATMNPNFNRDPDEYRALPFHLNGDLRPLIREAGETANCFIHTMDEARLLMAYRNQLDHEEDLKIEADDLDEQLQEEEKAKNKIIQLMQSDNVNLKFKGLQRINDELWRRGVLLCNSARKEERHEIFRRVIARRRGCLVSAVSMQEISEMDEADMRFFVSLAIANVLDDDYAIHAGALHVIKSGVEYGDDNMTQFIRRSLRLKTEIKNESYVESETASETSEMDRDGIETLVDWEADLVQASKEKGAILRTLEKEMAEKDEDLERTRRLTDRKQAMTSELLTENEKKALMDKPKRVPIMEELRAEVEGLKRDNPNHGLRRICNAIKEKHFDWIVPEGRVQKLLVDYRTSQRVKEEAKLTADREYPTTVKLVPDEESRKSLFMIFDDPLFIRGENGSIRLNETEADMCGYSMSRVSYMLHLQRKVADERGLPPEEVSMSEISQMERDEEEKRRQVEEGVAEDARKRLQQQQMNENERALVELKDSDETSEFISF